MDGGRDSRTQEVGFWRSQGLSYLKSVPNVSQRKLPSGTFSQKEHKSSSAERMRGSGESARGGTKDWGEKKGLFRSRYAIARDQEGIASAGGMGASRGTGGRKAMFRLGGCRSHAVTTLPGKMSLL